MNDVVIDNVTKNLTLVKGVLPTDIVMKTLHRLCVVFQITGYKNKTKEMTCNLIASQKFSDELGDGMYLEDALARNLSITFEANNVDDFSEPKETDEDEFGTSLQATVADVPVVVPVVKLTEKRRSMQSQLCLQVSQWQTLTSV
jgi:hypothetical protein